MSYALTAGPDFNSLFATQYVRAKVDTQNAGVVADLGKVRKHECVCFTPGENGFVTLIHNWATRGNSGAGRYYGIAQNDADPGGTVKVMVSGVGLALITNRDTIGRDVDTTGSSPLSLPTKATGGNVAVVSAPLHKAIDGDFACGELARGASGILKGGEATKLELVHIHPGYTASQVDWGTALRPQMPNQYWRVQNQTGVTLEVGKFYAMETGDNTNNPRGIVSVSTSSAAINSDTHGMIGMALIAAANNDYTVIKVAGNDVAVAGATWTAADTGKPFEVDATGRIVPHAGAQKPFGWAFINNGATLAAGDPVRVWFQGISGV